jgi:pimeloyl-ACP methyl ester carboxylesterase
MRSQAQQHDREQITPGQPNPTAPDSGNDYAPSVDHFLRLGVRVVHYCLYGDPDGVPIVSLGGSPSTRWKRPDIVQVIEQSGVHMLIPDRPGYGGSTRQPGRTVADVVEDVATLADAQDWDRFAVAGGSGGGPHALACAALLPNRVTRCAVSAGIMPPIVDGPEPGEDEDDPSRSASLWWAARGEEHVRPRIEEVARRIMASIEAGGPEILPRPGESDTPAPPARDDPAAMARLTATFVTSHDGWVDDNLALATDWGFTLDAIRVPTSIWYGDQDQSSRKHADLLTAAIPGAELFTYNGGHVQPAPAYGDMLAWLTKVDGTRE